MLKGRSIHGSFYAVQIMRMLRRKPEIGKFANLPDAIGQFAKCVKAAALILSYIVQSFYEFNLSDHQGGCTLNRIKIPIEL